jgi:hypothetical protein
MYGVRQTQMDMANQFWTQPSASEVLLAKKSIKSYKLPGVHQFSAKMIQEKKHCDMRCINLLSFFRTNQNCLNGGKSRLSYMCKKG